MTVVQLRVLVAAAFVLVVGVVAGVVVAIISTTSQTKERAALARQAEQLAESAQLETLRNCVRLNVESAKDRIFALERFDVVERIRIVGLSPIMDCKRSQLTGKSVPLSGEQTNAYVRVILRGRFPIVNRGRVVGSRPSLLEGVDSLDAAGRVP